MTVRGRAVGRIRVRNRLARGLVVLFGVGLTGCTAAPAATGAAPSADAPAASDTDGPATGAPASTSNVRGDALRVVATAGPDIDVPQSTETSPTSPPLPPAPLAIAQPKASAKWARGSLHWLEWKGTVSEAFFEISMDGGASWLLPDDEPESDYPPPVSPNRKRWRVPDDAGAKIFVRARTADNTVVANPIAIDVIASQAQSYTWTQRTADTGFIPRDGATLDVFGGRVLLLGGWNPDLFETNTTNEIWSSTDNGVTWGLDGVAPWEGRHTFGEGILDGRLYVMGGDALQGHYQTDVWATSDGHAWELRTAAAPWGERVLHYSVVHNGALWVMGGQTMPEALGDEKPVTYYSDVWRSTDGAQWTRVLAKAPWPARGVICGSLSFHGEMWVVGGGTYDTFDVPYRTYFQDAWSSPDGLTWTQHADAPWNPREYQSVIVWDDKMWMLGGYNDTGNQRDVWYSADGENWYELPNTPWVERHAASATVTAAGLLYGASTVPEAPADMWLLTKP